MTHRQAVKPIEMLLVVALLGVVTPKNSMASTEDQKATGDLSFGIGAQHEAGKYGTTPTTRSRTVPLAD
jgi:hypothetical protein